MLKKTIMLIALLTVALILMFSCTKKDNPFSPIKTGFNDAEQENISHIVGLDPVQDGTIQDKDPATSAIEGEVIIYFDDFMDANTITTSNIVVKDTTNNTSISGASLTYYPEIKKAVFRGTFSDDAVIIVTLMSGLCNSAGVEFDGNGNGLLDGSPYDDYRYRLRTGTAFLDTFDFIHPEIDWVSPGIGNSVSLTPIISLSFTPGDV
ncbi:hypothetical protein KAU34_05070, partial [candidate division WOR-3 bacterium]|nr:hypothetical protein [candidate division WOR-3 bacterium]